MHSFIGAIVYAILFGNVALLITTLDRANGRYRQRQDDLEEFCKIYDVPGRLADRLYNTHKALWHIHKGIGTKRGLQLRALCCS